jgi:hypothetical protein
MDEGKILLFNLSDGVLSEVYPIVKTKISPA